MPYWHILVSVISILILSAKSPYFIVGVLYAKIKISEYAIKEEKFRSWNLGSMDIIPNKTGITDINF